MNHQWIIRVRNPVVHDDPQVKLPSYSMQPHSSYLIFVAVCDCYIQINTLP